MKARDLGRKQLGLRVVELLAVQRKKTEFHYYRECASETNEAGRAHLHASLLQLMRQPSCRRRASAGVLQVAHFKQRYMTGLARVALPAEHNGRGIIKCG